MRNEFELGWVNFMDFMVARCQTKEKAYEKLCEFVKYLDYTEVFCSGKLTDAFKSLFKAEYLNAIVEGKHTTFTKLYKELADGKKPSLPKDKSYSGYGIKMEDINPGELYAQVSATNFSSGCGSSSFTSSSSRCGTSTPSHSSSRCGSSSSSRGSSRCGSSSPTSSYSSCGSSPSRC